MKKLVLKVGLLAVAAAVAFGSVWNTGATAEARAQYNKAFQAKYPDLAAAKEAKCGVCHPSSDDKKVRNDYAMAFGKGLGMKNQKDEAKINEALAAAEGEKNADGKTYGDLIKAGKLPGSK